MVIDENEFNDLKDEVKKLHKIIEKLCPHKDSHETRYTNGGSLKICDICGKEWDRRKAHENPH